MSKITSIYTYIKSKFTNYVDIVNNEQEVIVIFYKGFEMKVLFNGFYMIYFNDFFYYDIDEQDIFDTIDDIFLNQNMFCLKGNKIKIINVNAYKHDNIFTHVWTINQKLK